METYVEGWKLGLKALAIYRDGCKRSQPVNTGKTEDIQALDTDARIEKAIEQATQRPLRRRMPATVATRREAG